MDNLQSEIWHKKFWMYVLIPSFVFIAMACDRKGVGSYIFGVLALIWFEDAYVRSPSVKLFFFSLIFIASMGRGFIFDQWPIVMRSFMGCLVWDSILRYRRARL